VTDGQSLAETEDRPDIDRDVVASRIAAQATASRDRELERALARLDAMGELDDERRRVLEDMADSLTDRVLGEPCSTLTTIDDPGLLRAALAIFDSEE